MKMREIIKTKGITFSWISKRNNRDEVELRNISTRQLKSKKILTESPERNLTPDRIHD